jgi:hypothetical protein
MAKTSPENNRDSGASTRKPRKRKAKPDEALNSPETTSVGSSAVSNSEDVRQAPALEKSAAKESGRAARRAKSVSARKP